VGGQRRERHLFSEKTHCILYERLRIFFGDHNVGEQPSLNMGGTRCETSRRNMPSSSRKRRSQDCSTRNTHSKKSRTNTGEGGVVNLDDDNEDDFHNIDNYMDDENYMVENRDEKVSLTECLDILKPIYYSQTIINDQYVKAVNILKGLGQDRVAFKFLVEEYRMEWLQSIT
jgi:hypothetical protein